MIVSLLTNGDWGDSLGTLPAVRLLWGWKQPENADVLGFFSLYSNSALR